MIGSDAAAVQARLEAVQRAYTADLTEPATKAAMVGKADTLEVAAQLGRLTHMGRRGVNLTARYQIDNAGKRITFGLRPPGAWVIVERGAGPHAIRPRRGRAHSVFGGAVFGAGRAAVQGALGHPVAVAHHPGAHGRQGITRAFGRLRTVVPKAFHDAQVDQLRRIYA